MPNSQRKRTKVEYDGKASSKAREMAQLGRAYTNANIRDGLVLDTHETPWEASKAKRLAERIANGKTYANWLARNAKKQPKPSVTNLSV